VASLSVSTGTFAAVVVAGFVIACLSFVVAAFVGGWQVFAWLMDGRRVRVALVYGAHTGTAAITGKVRTDGSPPDLGQLHWPGSLEEVLGISVTNVGRAPVRIDGYGAPIVGGPVSLNPLADAIGPQLPFRLPPGETEAWYVRMSDVRALISSARAIRETVKPEVRMYVKLGTGDEKHSRRTLRVAS
jgi:hypothetical protein